MDRMKEGQNDNYDNVGEIIVVMSFFLCNFLTLSWVHFNKWFDPKIQSHTRLSTHSILESNSLPHHPESTLYTTWAMESSCLPHRPFPSPLTLQKTMMEDWLSINLRRSGNICARRVVTCFTWLILCMNAPPCNNYKRSMERV